MKFHVVVIIVVVVVLNVVVAKSSVLAWRVDSPPELLFAAVFPSDL